MAVLAVLECWMLDTTWSVAHLGDVECRSSGRHEMLLIRATWSVAHPGDMECRWSGRHGVSLIRTTWNVAHPGDMGCHLSGWHAVSLLWWHGVSLVWAAWCVACPRHAVSLSWAAWNVAYPNLVWFDTTLLTLVHCNSFSPSFIILISALQCKASLNENLQCSHTKLKCFGT